MTLEHGLQLYATYSTISTYSIAWLEDYQTGKRVISVINKLIQKYHARVDRRTRWQVFVLRQWSLRSLHPIKVVGIITKKKKKKSCCQSPQILSYFTCRHSSVSNTGSCMGGAPIWAGGHDPRLLESKGTGGAGGHNVGIIHISHIALITPLH